MDNSKIITQQPLPSSAVDFEIDDGDGSSQQKLTNTSGSELDLNKEDSLCHLTRLATVDKLYIKESVPIGQAFMGNTMNGRYEIMDENMKLLYIIPKRTRDSSFCAVWCSCCYMCYLCCCEHCINYMKGWDISDPTGRRPVVHASTVDSCFSKRLEATGPQNGETFGIVSQCCPIFRPFDNYNVHLNNDKVLDIQGPGCLDLRCVDQCGRIEYSIKNKNGENVGGLERKSRGQLSSSDEFILTFPKELDVRTKATLMAFVLFVDFMYLEQSHSGICSQLCCICP